MASNPNWIQRIINRFGEDRFDPRMVRAILDSDDLSEDRAFRMCSDLTKYEIAEFLPLAAARIGVSANNFAARLERCGVCPDAFINAHTSTRNGWKTFDLDINIGLAMVMRRAARVFAARFGALSSDSDVFLSGAISHSQAIALLKSIFTSYMARTFDYLRLSYPPITGSYVANLVDSIERFVIGHELGHVVIGSTSAPPNEFDFWLKTLGPVLQKAQALQLDDRWRNWCEEVAADHIGMTMVADFKRQGGFADHDHLYLSIELFFAVMDSLSTIGKADWLSSDHPAWSIRRDSFRTITRGFPEHLREMGTRFETFGKAVVESW